jgi:hypothetical protein
MRQVQKDDVDALLDEAFGPVIAKIMLDRAVLDEYYKSGKTMTEFALTKQTTRRTIEYLCEIYNLPTRLPRKPDNEIIADNPERADFDGKHYRY